MNIWCPLCGFGKVFLGHTTTFQNHQSGIADLLGGVIRCRGELVPPEQTITIQSARRPEGRRSEGSDPQLLTMEIWDNQVPDNFKPPPLATFDGKSDPQEHSITINAKISIIRATDSLKCKLMVGTLKDAATHWYTSLPRFSITSH